MEIAISFQTNVTSNIRFKAYETTAPSTVAGEVDASYDVDGVNVIITVPNDVAHIVRVFELDGFGAEMGLLLPEWLVTPQFNNVAIEKPIMVVVGRGETDPDTGAIDPDAGDTEIIITSLAGVDVAYAERRAFGKLKIDAEYTNRAGGGISVVQELENGETLFIQPPAGVSTSTPTPSTFAQLFSDTATITANTTLDTTYLQKLIVLAGASASLTITLDTIAHTSDKKHIGFIMPAGSCKQAKIVTQGSDKIKCYDGSTNLVTAIYLGVNKTIWLYKKDGVWYVLGDLYDNNTGQVIYGYSVLPGSLLADGSTKLRADYPGLWAYVNSLSLSSGVVTDATWSGSGDSYKSMFSYGNGSTTFRLPDLRGIGIRGLDQGRGLDLDRSTAGTHNAIGSYQADGIKTHNIPGTQGDSFLGGGGAGIVGRGGSTHENDITFTYTGSQDTHGKNAGLLPLIKY